MPACPCVARGIIADIDSISEGFDSPEQIQSLLLQYPMYDVAITETPTNTGLGGVASGQGVANLLKAPAWVDTLRQTGRLTVGDDVVVVRALRHCVGVAARAHVTLHSPKPLL